MGEAAAELFRALSKGSLTLVCAESCTGGLVTAAITDIPGSSEMLWGGVASYSNECKTALLGVPEGVIKSFGAVSPEVARAMADGALKVSGADIGLAVTGIAGPGGGSEAKPVGLVCFAWRSRSGAAEEASRIFPGDRKAVREAAAIFAMETAAEMAARLA